MRKKISYICVSIVLLWILLWVLLPSREDSRKPVAETQPIAAVPVEPEEQTEASDTPPHVAPPLERDEFQGEADPPPVILQGFVTNRGRAPIAGASISLKWDHELAAMTDEQGRFKISELSAEQNFLYVRHSDYVPKRIAIALDAQPAHVVLDRGAVLKGTIRRDGRVVADQYVSVTTNIMNSFTTRVARTDNLGVYQIGQLEPGHQRATASLIPDDDQDAIRKMTTEVILENERITVANFDFRNWDASLEGQILFNGEPFREAWINIASRTSGVAQESFGAKIDASGFFRFDALPSGLLDVSVSGVATGTTKNERTTTIEIPANVVTTKNFSFSGLGAIRGRCLGLKKEDSAIEDLFLFKPDISATLAEVGLEKMLEMDLGTSQVAQQKLEADGSFLVEGMEAGSYTLIVIVLSSTRPQMSYTYGSVIVSDAEETIVTLGPNWVTVKLELATN